MSTLIVEVHKIDDILPHDNADRLEIAIIKGWQCIVPKNKYKKGDKVVYIPIDAMVPFELSEKLGITKYLQNPKKDNLGNIISSRVKTVKLRGVISQGLIIDADSTWKVGDNVREKLGITKYIPNISNNYYTHNSISNWRLPEVPGFSKYTDIENYKNYIDIFEEGEEVVITEKLHGCAYFNDIIYLYNGKTQKIGNIVNKKLKTDVLGIDSNGNIVRSKILNWYNNGNTDNWKKVKFTRTGLLGNSYGSVIVTPNHEFFNPNLNEYIMCSDLKINDEILLYDTQSKLSFLQEQILIGIMIGDANLRNDNSILISHKKEHEEYINYTLKLLGDISGNKQKEQISGYGTLMVRARTLSNIKIKKLFEGWIINGKKEIPKSLIGKLSPISLAFWYMDDGSLSHNNKQEDRALFAVCRYNENSVNNLIMALKYININAVKYKSDDKHWRLRLNKDEANKLFILISPYIPKCMQYKLPEYYRTNNNPILKPDNKLSRQKIISVEDFKPKYNISKGKYDLETSTHNYFVNGVLVHNSNMRSARLIIDPLCFPLLQRVTIKLKKIGSILTLGLYKYDPTTFLVGSHNCNIKKSKDWEQITKIPLSNNSISIYWQIALKYGLDKKLKEGEEIFGEIYGTGIQKYLTYDGTEEVKIRFFDIKIKDKNGNMKYLDWDPFVEKCKYYKLPIVPVLYRGPFNKKILNKFISGNSTLGNHIREGCVIKPVKERFHPKLGRVVLKCINDDYLIFKGKKEIKLEKQGKEAEIDIFDH